MKSLDNFDRQSTYVLCMHIPTIPICASIVSVVGDIRQHFGFTWIHRDRQRHIYTCIQYMYSIYFDFGLRLRSFCRRLCGVDSALFP
jgi:hypothetical protein